MSTTARGHRPAAHHNPAAHHHPAAPRTTRRLTALAVVGALALAGCGGSGDPGAGDTPGTVTLVTHDSFALSDGLLEQFTADTGYDVRVVQPGDAGTLVNQLVLTADAPLGDVVFGIDNTYATRALDAGVLEPYESAAPAAADAARYAVGDGLTAIDVSDVCLNVDLGWFAERGLALPVTLDDVADPAYAGLTTVINPATSSTGLAFLAATVGAFGDDWPAYWERLAANDVAVADDWSDAYYADFSGGGGEGTRPVVVSYASSPPFTVPEGGDAPATAALLGTCFRQVEYAGVLAGAANPEGARAFVDFLLSDAVQADIPGSMYMHPVSSAVELPEDWARWAPLAETPFQVPAADVAAHREEWIATWTETVLG